MAYCSVCVIGKAAHPAAGWSLCMGLLERCCGYTNVRMQSTCGQINNKLKESLCKML